MNLCPWEASQYLIYSTNVPTLLFYSHIPAMLVAVIFGFVVYFKSGKSFLSKILLLISILFFSWSFFDLILWATNRPDMVMFLWSLQVLIEPLIFVLSFYLIFYFIKNKALSFWQIFFSLLPFIPIIILLPTNLNLIGININDCTALEGPIAHYYTYFLEIIFIILIFLFSVFHYYKNTDLEKKKATKTFSIGIILFLLAFAWGNIVGSFTDNWILAQAGLIGMPIFVTFISYLIVRFKTFNIKLLGVHFLVGSLLFLLLSILFVDSLDSIRIIVIVTLFLVSILSFYLIRSVKSEIAQRENLEKLNIDLKNLITQRESLMHLITHKIKGSFTRSKYIFAGLLDGSFGEISEQVHKMADTGLKSDDMGIKTVDLILNASNLQKGLVKFESKMIDFKDLVLQALNDKKPVAEMKNLKLESVIEEGDFKMSGDMFWIREVVGNLIDNAISYTKAGEVRVYLSKHNNILSFKVKDTGVGISKDDKKILFTEGGRGKDSVKVNVDSTGYGLFTVKLVVLGHGGRVWVESLGAGHGSTFIVELPLNI